MAQRERSTHERKGNYADKPGPLRKGKEGRMRGRAVPTGQVRIVDGERGRVRARAS
jgi:hypothetical protein